MKILIAGAGKVGKSITDELSADGNDITMIDRNADVLNDVIEKYDVNTCEGNAASSIVLKEAGVEDADIFIAVADADEINLLACITARALNPKIHVIARIRNPEYAEQAYVLKDSFHLSLSINPEKQAAQEIAGLLKYPGFLKRERFEKARTEMVELRAESSSALADVKLTDLQKRINAQILISAIIRDGNVILPDGNTVIQSHDRLFITGRSSELQKMLKNIGVITKPVRHVLISGGGRIAFYLAQLLDDAHISTTIIEQDEDTCELLAGLLSNTTIVHGDASSHNVLENADIQSYDAFVSLTGIDEVNIITSLYADVLNIKHIITKLGRGEQSLLTDHLPLGSIVCPKDLVTMHIVRYVRAIQDKKGVAITIHKIADGRVEAIEFEVKEHDRYIGKPLKDIRMKKNILINSIRTGLETVIPNGNSAYHLGDTVVVLCKGDEVIHTLNDIFES